MKQKPFLRWAGGKCKLVNTISKFVPQKINRYWEPFLGAGSLFFKLCPTQATLSDLNKSLIECYKTVKNDPDKLFKHLEFLTENHSEENYYIVRESYNKLKKYNFIKSAMFIYLNKTCFNGIFRVNQQGNFNTPYGKILNPALPTKEELIHISLTLKNIDLICQSYEKIFDQVSSGDFIYIDPPYPPLNDTSKFVEYTKERFSSEDQIKLAQFANQLSNKRCNVMISNTGTPQIMDLYRDWNIQKTHAIRTISCKKKRHRVEELIITNY